jgi:hypothetical protein
MYVEPNTFPPSNQSDGWQWLTIVSLLCAVDDRGCFEQQGVPPVPIPGGAEGCCEEMPWSLSPAPDCSAFELNYPVTLNPSPAPLQPWDVDK